MTQQTNWNNQANITSKRLSVQISMTGLSFLVSDVHTGSSLGFDELTFEKAQTPDSVLHHLKKALDDKYGESEFENVDVVYANTEYTVVPTSLFDETKASDYLKLDNKILSNDYIAFDQIENSGLTVVYIPLVNVNNFLFDTFGAFKYYHVASLILDKLRGYSSLKEETRVLLHVLRDHFDMVVWNKDQLLMCNSFPYNGPEDFIYFTLFGFEQLSLDPDSVPVTLMGQIQKEGDLYEIAYKYIRNLIFYDQEGAVESAEADPANVCPALKLL